VSVHFLKWFKISIIIRTRMAQLLMLLTCILKASVTNIGWDTKI